MQQELQVDFTWQSVDPVLVVVVLILVSLFFFLIARKTKAPKTKKHRKMMRMIAQSYGKKTKKLTLNYTITSLEGKNSIMEFFIRNKLPVNH